MRKISKTEFIRIMRAGNTAFLACFVGEELTLEELWHKRDRATHDREVMWDNGKEILFSDGSKCDLSNKAKEKRECFDLTCNIYEVRITSELSDGAIAVKHMYYSLL